MIWFLLEMGLAAAIFVFIVWWTLPRDKKAPDAAPPADDERP